MNDIEEAKKIIANNLYMVIGTVDRDQPWVTPVYMAYDDEYNFYWASELETRHSKLIENNSKISIVIFDPSVPEGTGKGVYMEALATIVDDVEEIKRIIPIMYDRKNKPHRAVEDFSGTATRRIYKAIPSKVWVKLNKDSRIEINL